MTFSHSLRRRIRRVSVSFLGVSATFILFSTSSTAIAVNCLGAVTSAGGESRGHGKRPGRRTPVLGKRSELLHPENLDPDMLDERARLMLNFGHPDELVSSIPRSRNSQLRKGPIMKTVAENLKPPFIAAIMLDIVQAGETTDRRPATNWCPSRQRRRVSSALRPPAMTRTAGSPSLIGATKLLHRLAQSRQRARGARV